MSQRLSDVSSLRELGEKELLIYNAEAQRHQRSVLVAYLLCLLLWPFGAHAAYIGKPLKAVSYPLLGCAALGISWIGTYAERIDLPTGGAAAYTVAWLLAGVLALHLVWDLLTLPRQIRKRDDRVRSDLIGQLTSQRPGRGAEA